MAKGFRAEQIIDAPPNRVWMAATDISRMHEWMPGVASVDDADGAAMHSGKMYSVKLKSRRAPERRMTVAQWNPRQRFALASRDGSVDAVYTYDFESAGDGTRVILEGTCVAGSFAMKLLRPLIVRAMARHDKAQVDLLKQMIEGRQSA